MCLQCGAASSYDPREFKNTLMAENTRRTAVRVHEDFELPPGDVRHCQTTDDGQKPAVPQDAAGPDPAA